MLILALYGLALALLFYGLAYVLERLQPTHDGLLISVAVVWLVGIVWWYR